MFYDDIVWDIAQREGAVTLRGVGLGLGFWFRVLDSGCRCCSVCCSACCSVALLQCVLQGYGCGTT